MRTQAYAPGVLSLSLPDPKLHELFLLLLDNANRADARPQLLTSHIQAIGVVSYVVGNRVGLHVDAGVKSIMSLMSRASEEDVELLESCLHALESFISRSPLFTRSYIDTITDVCLKLLRFDPNYADDADDTEDEEMQTEDEEEDL